jgi:serine/threonine protein kinase
MRPKPGDLISGKYRLIRLIGDGGMGSVFEARHEYLGTGVALKFLHPELALRPGLVARFLREARLSASIKSIHIARVTDVDQVNDGIAYLVMELLEGDSLTSLLEREKRLSLEMALDYTLQMLAGLEAAHAVGVVHRDLKPDNVFVVTTPRGPLVKLLDFGIAKLRSSREFQVALTRPGVMMGTPEYMAPEQVTSADSVDARADVYSVGAILYEMLAGKRPAPGDDAVQIAAFILSKKVTRLSEANPSVPEGLADVVHRAMAPSATDRFGSAAELRNALVPFSGSMSLAGRLAATPGVAVVAPTWPPEAEKPGVPAATQAEAVSSTPPSTPASPPPPATQKAAPWSPAYAPVGYGYSPEPPRVDVPIPTGVRRPRRRFSGWLLLVMVLVSIGIIALALTMEPTTPKRKAEVATTATPVPAAADAKMPTPVRAAPSSIAPPIQPPQPTATPATSAGNRPPSKAQHADAGAGDAAPNVGIPGFPQLPFPMPTGLPLPSAFPLPIPLPSGFPPFGIPGFPQPAPAGSSAP